MAIIGSLRNKMTKWVIGFVSVAIVSFILNDLLGNGPRSILKGESDNVGKIAGNSVSIDEYQAVIQERENNYILSTGRQPGQNEKNSLQQQAWDVLVMRNTIIPQMDEVGVEVTKDEVWDMIQGKNIDPGIQQAFRDSLGKFDRKKAMDYINSLNIPEPTEPRMASMWREQRYRWDMYERDLGLSRRRMKYENLLIKTNYVTQAEAAREYHVQNDVMEASYVYVPFFAVSDSLAKPTDAQLNEYYSKNKKRYPSKFTRDMKYIAFAITPSSADSAQYKKAADKLAQEFKTVADDSIFAVSNTDGAEPFKKYHIGNLPASLQATVQSGKAGEVVGPFMDNGKYKIIKIVKSGTDTSYYAKASHILIKWENDTPEAKKAAKDKAQKILDEIKKGADFATKARENGQDGTASQGGDLGWFGKNQMVKPFEKAVFDATKAGVLPTLVETQFGYHIIKVTNVKNNTSYTIATIEVNISPSDETTNTTYQKAQNFATSISNETEFTEQAKKDNLFVQDANALLPDARYVGSLGEARSVVIWLFRDAKKGKVSDVLDLSTQYVVAVMTGETEEGTKPLSAVKDEVTTAVKKELKAESIIAKLNAQKGELQEKANAFAPNGSVQTINDLKMTTASLPAIGFDPIVVGRAFSLSNNQTSAPFAGDNGVVIIKSGNKTVAPDVADYTQFKTQLMQSLDAKSGLIGEAIKENSQIKDKRYKFY